MILTIDSICLISSIIDKIEIDDKFIQEMLALGRTGKGKSKEDKENLQKQIGMKVVLKISSKLHLAKEELIEFISTYKGISKEEAKKEDVIPIIKELMNDEDFKVFLEQKLMSK